MKDVEGIVEMQEINASPLVQLVAGQVSVVVLVAACRVQVWSLSLHRPLYTTSSRVPATERDTASPHHQLQHCPQSHTTLHARGEVYLESGRKIFVIIGSADCCHGDGGSCEDDDTIKKRVPVMLVIQSSCRPSLTRPSEAA